MEFNYVIVLLKEFFHSMALVHVRSSPEWDSDSDWLAWPEYAHTIGKIEKLLLYAYCALSNNSLGEAADERMENVINSFIS